MTALALVLFAWNLQCNEFSNRYYSAAVRSMGTSWHAFRYASVDGGGWVSVDKPPLSLWLGSLSTRLLGFHPWTVMLPSVVLAAATVWLLMATVRTVAGDGAALVSGVVLAVTPILVAVARSNLPDVPLMFFCVVAAWAAVRAYASTSWRWPVLLGAAAGAGFLTKSVAVGVVLPGIGAGYLLAGRGSVRQRLLRGAAAATVFVAVVGLWLASVDLVALSHRPWIGSSSDGSAWNLVFGYHASFFGGEGGLPASIGHGPGVLGELFDAFGAERGVGRMFNGAMGDQLMWWFPLAAFGGLAALAGRPRWRRRDPLVGAAVMWVLWTVVAMFVFSFTKGVLHPYYVVLLAPALAALAGIGSARIWLAPQRPWWALGATAIVATALVQLILLRRNPSYRWVRPAVVAAAAVVVAAAVVAPVARRRGVGDADGLWWPLLWRRSVAVAGVVLLLAPGLWSLTGIRHPMGGLFPTARPGYGFSSGPPDNGQPYGSSDVTEQTLRWLDSQRTTERWTIAMASAMVAAPAIIEGHRVMAVGGFGGSDASASAPRVARAIADGRLRYVLAGGASANGLAEPAVFAAVRSACELVPASAWGGTGVSGVYDCRGKSQVLLEASR